MLHKTDQKFDHPVTYFYKTDLGPLPEFSICTLWDCIKKTINYNKMATNSKM